MLFFILCHSGVFLCNVCIFLHCWLHRAKLFHSSRLLALFSNQKTDPFFWLKRETIGHSQVSSESPVVGCRTHWSHSCMDVLTTPRPSHSYFSGAFTDTGVLKGSPRWNLLKLTVFFFVILFIQFIFIVSNIYFTKEFQTDQFAANLYFFIQYNQVC